MSDRLSTRARAALAAASAVSAAALSLCCQVGDEAWATVAGMAASVAVAIWFWARIGEDIAGYVKRHKGLGFACLVWGGVSVLLSGAGGIAAVLAVPAAGGLLLAFCVWIKGFVRALFDGLDDLDRKLYAGVSLVVSLAVVGAYLVLPGLYMQYDHVYSMDSGFVLRAVFDLRYMDIRHTALQPFAFPFAAVAGFAASLLPPGAYTLCCAVLLQLVNVQFLVLAGFMVRDLAGSRWILVPYFLSWPFVSYALFFEKYQVASFLVVLSAWYMAKFRRASAQLAIATGAMSSSGVMFLGTLLSDEPWKVRLKSFAKACLAGVCLLLSAGRGRLLDPRTFVELAGGMLGTFGVDAGPGGLFNSLTALCGSTLFPVPGAVGTEGYYAGRYIWTDATLALNRTGIEVMLIVAVGAVLKRKEYFYRLCAMWAGFAVVMVCVFRWAPDVSPLFGLCFLWAFLPLACAVVERLRSKAGIGPAPVYCAMAAVMACLDVAELSRMLPFVAGLTVQS